MKGGNRNNSQVHPVLESVSGHLGHFATRELGAHGVPDTRPVLGMLQWVRHGPAFMKVLSQWRRPTSSLVITTQDNVCHNPSVCGLWEGCN